MDLSPSLYYTVTCCTLKANVSPGENLTRITTGYFHTCALQIDGGLACWGYNKYGQLGIGSTIDVGTGHENITTVDFGTGVYVIF